jgi:hypothetical protein
MDGIAKNKDALVCGVSTVLLAFAICPWSSESNQYYGFLRVMVFAATAFLFQSLRDAKFERIRMILLVIGLIYNPFVKVTLDHGAWIAVDILTAIFFADLGHTLIGKPGLNGLRRIAIANYGKLVLTLTLLAVLVAMHWAIKSGDMANLLFIFSN